MVWLASHFLVARIFCAFVEAKKGDVTMPGSVNSVDATGSSSSLLWSRGAGLRGSGSAFGKAVKVVARQHAANSTDSVVTVKSNDTRVSKCMPAMWGTTGSEMIENMDDEALRNLGHFHSTAKALGGQYSRIIPKVEAEKLNKKGRADAAKQKKQEDREEDRGWAMRKFDAICADLGEFSRKSKIGMSASWEDFKSLLGAWNKFSFGEPSDRQFFSGAKTWVVRNLVPYRSAPNIKLVQNALNLELTPEQARNLEYILMNWRRNGSEKSSGFLDRLFNETDSRAIKYAVTKWRSDVCRAGGWRKAHFLKSMKLWWNVQPERTPSEIGRISIGNSGVLGKYPSIIAPCQNAGPGDQDEEIDLEKDQLDAIVAAGMENASNEDKAKANYIMGKEFYKLS